MTDRMGVLDAAWLHMDQPTNLMVITSLVLLEEAPDWDAVVELLRDRLVDAYPRFRQRVEDHDVGRPRWVDDPHFDIALHVQRVALPAPADEDALRKMVGEVMGHDLDRRRPLWQVWMIDGPGDGATLLFRIHHSVADGISLAAVLLSLADGVELPGAKAPNGEPPADHHRGALEALRTGAGVVGAVVHDTVMPHDPPNPLRGEQSARKVAAWSGSLSLAEVKAAAKARGATINDVLMAALSGALGRYFDHVGHPVDQIRATVPVSLRPTGVMPPATLGNEFALVFCPLPVGIRDPEERLVAVKAAMDKLKGSPAEALASVGLLASMGMSPRAVEDRLVSFYGAKSSLVVSNVPGPREPISLAGTTVAGILSWAPQSGPVSTSVTIVSYAGRVFVGLATDPALVADPEVIVDAFADEVSALTSSTR